MSGGKREPLGVEATPDEIRRGYGTLSRIYAIIEAVFEKGLRKRGLELLAAAPGETVLEIGVGAGYSLKEIAGSVGRAGPPAIVPEERRAGRACGLDITPQMLEITGKKLKRAGLADRVGLYQGDARQMPFPDGRFDAVYMASTLELFDTPDIPVVLNEVKRVLRPGGRLVAASLDRTGREGSLFVRIYEWLHRKMPKYASCRPIYLEESVAGAGYRIEKSRPYLMYGMVPWRIVLARAGTI